MSSACGVVQRVNRCHLLLRSRQPNSALQSRVQQDDVIVKARPEQQMKGWVTTGIVRPFTIWVRSGSPTSYETSSTTERQMDRRACCTTVFEMFSSGVMVPCRNPSVTGFDRANSLSSLSKPCRSPSTSPGHLSAVGHIGPAVERKLLQPGATGPATRTESVQSLPASGRALGALRNGSGRALDQT
eukprot:scaffold4044_cov399-Prasinococcus_capsulatus_cf.AAC.11